MPTPSRLFPGGISDVKKAHPFGMLGMPSPTRFHAFVEDFDRYLASDWIVTETQAGATQALVAGRGGLLALTNSAADNDVNGIQNAIASFAPTAGKQAWFYAVANVSDAIQSDFVLGLQVVNTAFITGVTDGIFFQKDDGDAQLDCWVKKNDTTGKIGLTNVGTIVSGTYFSVAWHYDGKSSTRFFFNDVHVGTLDSSSTYLPDTNLTVTAALVNGDAVARTFTIDKLIAIEEV